ncbi:KAP family NTPase [Rhizobium sp. NRK18]|uniref:KAP family P-loop NTPase fold protein n=1 Tax=Rhizobium sp. NRK18 TaxID=2964667 RepID=UPI0021C47548|nr:KAP family NTPase [Rhizobium sp. NRK18]MCQ2004403.1 KAP family NTPase [Rhizobium sp. NRK18]
MDDIQHRKLDADRPINSTALDRFGFCDVAKKLAQSVVSAAAQQGMVIAIEGKWGSGKSSLTNLLKLEIDGDTTNNVSVISFSPWLIGDKASMVVALIGAIAKTCEELEKRSPEFQDESLLQRARKHSPKLAENLRSFGVATSRRISPLLSMAGLFNPALAVAGAAVSKGGDLLDAWAADDSLDKKKADISAQLNALSHRFVVLIDDMDRLEPSQANEVIRLVRSVADFPNVIYVLCHDKEILSHAIEQSLGVKDGNAYLQKIIQVSFSIPRPEPFDLRQWLQEELLVLYEKETGVEPAKDLLDDLQTAVSTVGSLLQTPRDVKMVLNSVKFHFPPVKDSVYYPDLCWLHLRRILDTELYALIERYLPEWAVISQGYARPSSDETKAFTDDLERRLTNDDSDSLHSIWSLTDYVPGIRKSSTQERKYDIFAEISDKEIQALESRKRLGSPSHYRYYFAFSPPKGSQTESEFEAMIALAKIGTNEFRSKLVAMSLERRPVGGSWLDYFIDRVRRQNIHEWETDTLVHFCQVIADVMDVVGNSNVVVRFLGRNQVSQQARILVYNMLSILRQQDTKLFDATFRQLVQNGAAIGWLVEEFINSELRRHGKVGDNPQPENTFLTTQELAFAIERLLGRLKDANVREKLEQVPDLASTLFRWKELDNNSLEEPKKWFLEHTRSNEQFVRILNRMRGWSSSTDGITRPLNRRDVAPFTDWEQTKIRLKQLAGNTSEDPSITRLAQELVSEIRERD